MCKKLLVLISFALVMCLIDVNPTWAEEIDHATSAHTALEHPS